MNQSLKQKQTQRFTPQQILVATMVQATTDELENLITAETEKNLALEVTSDTGAEEPIENGQGSESVEDEGNETDSSADVLNDTEPFFDYDDDSPSDKMNRSAEDAYWTPLNNYSSETTSREELLEQISEMELDDEEEYLARYLVNSLDDSGYMTRSLQDICDELAFTQMHDTTVEELERVLVDVVQTLDPVGIGARTLRECLLLQLQELRATEVTRLAYRMVDECFDDLAGKRYKKICETLNTTPTMLSRAQRIVARLNPKPGGMESGTDRMEAKASHIQADFSIHVEDGELLVQVLDGMLPVVRINPEYQEMLQRIQQSKSKSEDSKQGAAMIRDSISSGNLFIDALRIRRETLSRVIMVIAHMQKEYFLSGGDAESLKPMGLQPVADACKYDISTISRVCNSKYIDTDFGIIPVRSLFTSAIETEDGESISNVAAQNALRQLIEEENKQEPLSDESLSALMKEKGYPIARRTVTKYREALGFASARLRREIL